MKNFIKSNIPIIILTFWFTVILLINIRINVFRYNNFDFGKFDLGNMTQMVWNTLHGRVLYLTDYFGANVPRWSMSHVDPILLLFVPIFAIFQHPLTLVLSQVLLLLLSSFLVYLIANLELKSKVSALFLGLAFLFYPALGYITATTGFHGVSSAIPFFLAAFYVFEKMYRQDSYSRKNLILFWAMLIITMSGKEQLPLYVFIFALFILVLRRNIKTIKIAISMLIVSTVWFVLAFFVIIPSFAHYRVESFNNFAKTIGIDVSATKDVSLDNYFLGRYDAFGTSYSEIGINMLRDPQKTIRVFFGGDRLKNLNRTFQPMLYLPLAFPLLLVIASPDILINYLTSASGVGTAEIENHRISMIIPVLFISTIYAIGFLSRLFQKRKRVYQTVLVLLSFLVLSMNVVTSFTYNNPVYLWLNQALNRKFSFIPVYAKFDKTAAKVANLKVGSVLSISYLDDKDVECANRVVETIPSGASVSGPDSLGAHLSMRETYAVFPALYNSADYVIMDVFSRKIFSILNIDTGLVKDIVYNILKDPGYNLQMACGNLFVFQKASIPQVKSDLLPLQETFTYPEKFNYEIFNSLFVVDYKVPSTVERGKPQKAQIVYIRRNNNNIADYILYMTYLNVKTGEVYQAANLPSFAISEPEEWNTGTYFIEDVDMALPKYIDSGTYRVFIGMSNRIRTRNLYLGDIEVK